MARHHRVIAELAVLMLGITREADQAPPSAVFALGGVGPARREICFSNFSAHASPSFARIFICSLRPRVLKSLSHPGFSQSHTNGAQLQVSVRRFRNRIH